MKQLCLDTSISIKIMLSGCWNWLHLVALQKEDLNNWRTTVRMPPQDHGVSLTSSRVVFFFISFLREPICLTTKVPVCAQDMGI